jgi:hypothetical protein
VSKELNFTLTIQNKAPDFQFSSFSFVFLLTSFTSSALIHFAFSRFFSLLLLQNNSKEKGRLCFVILASNCAIILMIKLAQRLYLQRS